MTTLVPEANPTEQPSSGITIVKRTPSQLEAVKYLHEGMAALLRQAFNFPYASATELQGYLEREFGGNDQSRVAYLAYKGKDVVGALVVNKLLENDRGVGQRFWENLAIKHGEFGMRRKLREISEVPFPLMAAHISATILPQTDQGHRLHEDLLRAMNEDLHPHLLIDMVTSPDDAQVETSTLAPLGYFVFLNRSEITPGARIAVDSNAIRIRDSFYEATDRDMAEGGFVFTDRRPFVPREQTSFYAGNTVKELFRQIEERRISLPPGKTLEIPFIAIPKKVSELFGVQLHRHAA